MSKKKGDLGKEQLLFPDKISTLDEEEWLVCMTSSFFLK
jgi:hypothetical protein